MEILAFSRYMEASKRVQELQIEKGLKFFCPAVSNGVVREEKTIKCEVRSFCMFGGPLFFQDVM